MTRYVFDSPEQMFDWVDRTAKKLLSIPRDEFGKIKIEITRTYDSCNYPWEIDPREKEAWKKRFENEKR